MATTQPSDSPAPSAAALVPLACDLPQRECLFLLPPGRASTDAQTPESDYRVSIAPDFPVERLGYPRLLGHPRTHVPKSITPPSVAPSRPVSVTLLLPSSP
jgi:hypothetical protein